MSWWLDPLARALDDAARPVDVFFRDDDAGWDDPALYRLLDVFAPTRTPVDVAAIPTEVTPELAGELLQRASDGVRVHQHGYSHTNHEVEGRKCEFGPGRRAEDLAADIAEGQRRLRALFDAGLDPVFTPPWNRCGPGVVAALESVGITVLSRDITARALDVETLHEVPVTVDWFAHAKGEPWTAVEIGRRLGDSARSGRVGLMLHHAVTSAEDLEAITEIVDLIAAHPMVRRTSILELATDQCVS